MWDCVLLVWHSKGIYKEPLRPNIVEIFNIATSFLGMVDEDKNGMLKE